MIQVTLQFPSIAAMLAALGGLPSADVAAATVKEVKDTPAKPQAEKTAASSGATLAGGSAPVSKPEPVASREKAADEGVLDYAVLQQAVFKLAGQDKPAALAINAQFGVKSMKDLPEAKRREALAAVNAKIDELTAAVA